MQRLSRRRRLDRVRTWTLFPRHASGSTVMVDGVADHRMPDMRQVNADLMSTAGEESHPHHIAGRKSRHGLDQTPGGPPGGKHHHPLPVFGMSSDRRVDVERCPNVSPDKRRIDTLDLSMPE